MFMSLSLSLSPVKDNPKRKSLAKELEEEEYLLRQCVEKLKSVQGSRTSLVNQLKDALREQVLLIFSCWQVNYFAMFIYYVLYIYIRCFIFFRFNYKIILIKC